MRFYKQEYFGGKFHISRCIFYSTCKIFMTDFEFMFDTIHLPFIFRKFIFQSIYTQNASPMWYNNFKIRHYVITKRNVLGVDSYFKHLSVHWIICVPVGGTSKVPWVLGNEVEYWVMRLSAGYCWPLLSGAEPNIVTKCKWYCNFTTNLVSDIWSVLY